MSAAEKEPTDHESPVTALVILFVIECARMYFRRGLTREWWAETASSLGTQIPFYFSEILVFTASVVSRMTTPKCAISPASLRSGKVAASA